MSRKSEKQLERQSPGTRGLVRSAKGDHAAAAALADHETESEVKPQTGGLMVDRLEIGQAYWIETPNWVYIGEIVDKGIDYIVLGQTVRVHVDGRHHTMMTTGSASGMEIELTGGKQRVMIIPVDWIGPTCPWDFDIPPQTPAS